MVQRIIVADRAVGTAALDRESGTETRHRHADRRTSSQTRTHARIHRTAAGAAALNAKLLLQSVARMRMGLPAAWHPYQTFSWTNERIAGRPVGRSATSVIFFSMPPPPRPCLAFRRRLLACSQLPAPQSVPPSSGRSGLSPPRLDDANWASFIRRRPRTDAMMLCRVLWRASAKSRLHHSRQQQ